MAKIQPIKSLDELQTGDVVEYEVWPGIAGVPCIVDSIGEVPGHEREVLLQMLYEHDSPESKVSYDPRTVRESDLRSSDIIKLERKNYKGWKYVEIKRVD